MSERPLSPHLQVYRLPFTAILSISHRITGVLLNFGLLWWVYYLTALANGAEAFAFAQDILTSLIGKVLLWVWIFALIYHLCHGVRHLVWDTGIGFERKNQTRDGMIELSAALILTMFTLLACSVLKS